MVTPSWSNDIDNHPVVGTNNRSVSHAQATIKIDNSVLPVITHRSSRP